MDTSKFSENLLKAWRFAEDAQQRYHTNYLGSEHILLGLLSVRECLAARLLAEAQVTLQDYASLFLQYITPDSPQPEANTGNAERIMRTASEIAMDEGMSVGCVLSEHVLLAITMIEDCRACLLLRGLGVDIGMLGRRVEEVVVAERTRGTGAGIFRYIKNPESAKQIPGASVQEPSTYTAAALPSEFLQYGTDVTEQAAKGLLDPVIGRRKEIEKVIQILTRRTKNNPVLIGEPGVGKSAVVEGLAQAIVAGEVPEPLRNKKIYSLNLAALLSGTKYRGEFEERIQYIVEYIALNRTIILFIDEIHMIVGAGSSTDSNMDAANIFKPRLARGELQTVGATTTEEYRKFIEKDAALERRFTPVVVAEPSVEEAIIILRGVRDKYERYHGVSIPDEAIRAAVKLSDRYVSDRFLPDKAIDLMDEAASRKQLSACNGPGELRDVEEKLKELEEERKEVLGGEKPDYLRSSALTSQIDALGKRRTQLREQWESIRNASRLSIDAGDIAEIVGEWTGIPVSQITEEEGERLTHLEEDLHKRIIGQDEAVAAVAKAVRRARTGLGDPSRPIGSFIFVGPTGVGKTDLSKALAELLFGDERMMIRLDMSEFMEKGSVTKLIGAPPGYVGYNDMQGCLTERVRKKPYSVVLFDEIEKAHPDIFNMLLQILDDGRLTDSRGRTVSFKNTIIILTSNVGAHRVQEVSTLGFGGDAQADAYQLMKKQIEEALQKQFRPELLNRIDDIVVFRKLSKEDATIICDRILKGTVDRLKAQQQIEVTVSPSVKWKLVEEGYDEELGARPLKRIVQRLIEDRLSDELLSGRLPAGRAVSVDLRDGEIVFRVK